MTENAVVIKINYASKKPGTPATPRMITVWHVPRIIGVLLILLGLIVWLWPAATVEISNPNITEIAVPEIQTDGAYQLPETAGAATDYHQSVSKQPLADSGDLKSVINDKHVIRAALVTEINAGEPNERINPVVQLQDKQSLELFYFSQVKRLQNKPLYHQWLKADQLMLKKELIASQSVSKLISSRKFSVKDKGVWRVAMTDQKGKVLSESRFVIK